MLEFKVLLNMIEDAKKFVSIASKYNMDIIARNPKSIYEVDASSIMGMFSLDLSDPIIITTNNDELGRKFKTEVKKYIVH
ncbi:HPr family phosphocarrier protein [Clostridium sp. AF34-13]|uniref:HPr family phosphocarrier protein n=1 Tax=Clostridium sp. AF34-13 TaxID=2293012 RepID=UPI000E4E0F94|nr:HPr family phosphocarrier protein [Clostridium sp. AF34-13]RHP22547.1 HPr family phosphocarrier protein [Clostridium sp. AF34-13]